MAYRISATLQGGAGISVIVETPREALAKIADYQEDGLTGVTVRDMDGAEVDPVKLVVD